MKTPPKRILIMVLALCLCLAVVPAATMKVEAATPYYSVSSSYKASSYYTALCNVTLTGNQREDIVNVALSQVGYREGSSANDYSGADDGSYNNYTEYNYWYHNYVSSDMPVGGAETAPWCATFVSWCAEQANIPTSILQRSKAAGHGSRYFNVNFYSGSSTLASSGDNDSYFMGYDYIPQMGDLFFTRSWSHVGLVVAVNGPYVITVEGNTNTTGSPQGNGVYRLTMRRIADLYFGVPNYATTTVPEKPIITTTSPYYDEGSSIPISWDAVPGNTYYWINVYKDGELIANQSMGNETTYTIENASKGTYTFAVSSNNSMGGSDGAYYSFLVNVVPPKPEIINDAPYYSNGDSVNVKWNTVVGNEFYWINVYKDGKLIINQETGNQPGYTIHSVCEGVYTIFVSANNSAGTSGSDSYTFVVGNPKYTINYNANGGSNAPSSQTKLYNVDLHLSTAVPIWDGYVFQGWATNVSSSPEYQPGDIYTTNADATLYAVWSPICADGHVLEPWYTIAEATCTAKGEERRDCTNCDYHETREINVVPHSYASVVTPPTRTEQGYTTHTCTICGDRYIDSYVEAIGHLPGDINGDGLVNNKDLTRLFQYLSNYDVDVVEAALDTNGDGSVNNKDLTRLFQYLSDWDVELSGGTSSTTGPLSEDLQQYEVLSTSVSPDGTICTSFRFGESVLGRDLVCWSIQPEDYSRTILLNFAIHGWEDSYAADGQLLVNLGNALVEHYSERADLQACRLLIVPCANPDGIAEGITQDGFGRCNADGIDLNRDFDANHVVYTNDRNYTPAPFSGVESQALRDLVWAADPDIVIDFHGWLNYTIGSSELAEVFSTYVGLNHKNELTTSAHGYFSYWAQLQGAEAILVEFKDTASIVHSDVILAVDQLIADNYGSKQSNYALDSDFAEYSSIVAYALTSDKIYTQKQAGDMGTSYGYIDGAADECTILQIYDNGWCKVNYPVGSLTKTGYCKISAFIDPEAKVAHYTAQVGETVKVYTTSTITTQLGSVWNTDVFTVIAEKDGMAQIIYPLDSGGYKMGWIDASMILKN